MRRTGILLIAVAISIALLLIPSVHSAFQGNGTGRDGRCRMVSLNCSIDC